MTSNRHAHSAAMKSAREQKRKTVESAGCRPALQFALPLQSISARLTGTDARYFRRDQIQSFKYRSINIESLKIIMTGAKRISAERIKRPGNFSGFVLV
jgi:hypothetical protein